MARATTTDARMDPLSGGGTGVQLIAPPPGRLKEAARAAHPCPVGLQRVPAPGREAHARHGAGRAVAGIYQEQALGGDHGRAGGAALRIGKRRSAAPHSAT